MMGKVAAEWICSFAAECGRTYDVFLIQTDPDKDADFNVCRPSDEQPG
jgi:hypothetical protein